MKRIFQLVCCILLLINLVPLNAKAAYNDVFITDPNVEQQIRNQIAKPQGDITIEDMQKVNSLTFYDNSDDLHIISYAQNLKSLEITAANTSNWSFLNNLPLLTDLTISGTNFKDFAEIKNSLHLKVIKLPFNELTNLNGLEYLANVSFLDLTSNKLTDITPIHNAANNPNVQLKYLNILGNPINYNEDATWNQLHYLMQEEQASVDYAYSDQPITGSSALSVNNPAFERAVRMQLAVKPSADLTSQHIKEAKKLNLSGIEAPFKIIPFENLESLQMGSTNPENIPFSEISSLPKLKSLNLSDAMLQDISFIENITQLEVLNLGNQNFIKDLTSLAKLTNLQELELPGDMGGRAITSIDELKNMPNLTKLNLGNNLVRNIEPLAGLTRLTDINLGSNQIRDLGPLVENVMNSNGRENIAIELGFNPLALNNIQQLEEQNVQLQYNNEYYTYFEDLVPTETEPQNGAKYVNIHQLISIPFNILNQVEPDRSYDEIQLVDENNHVLPILKRIRDNSLQISADLEPETSYKLTVPWDAISRSESLFNYKKTYLEDDIVLSFETESELTSLQLNKESYVLTKGESTELTLTANYKNGEHLDVTSRSEITTDNPAVAKLEDGKLNGYTTGITKVKAAYNGFQTEAEVKIIPQRPVVNPVSEHTTEMDGVAETGTEVVVKWEDHFRSGPTDQNGNFHISIPELPIGTVLTVHATDSSGLNSEEATVTVYDAPPPSPQVNIFSDIDTTLTGKTLPNTSIEVYINGTIYTAEPDLEGNFSVEIPMQPASASFYVTAIDEAGNRSEPAGVYVRDKTPPMKPIIQSKVGNNTTKITGLSDTHTTVFAFVGEKEIGKAVLNYLRSFELTIKAQPMGTNIEIYAVDISGNKSENAIVTVSDITPPPAPFVNPIMDNELTVTGKAEANSTVTVESSGGTYLFGIAVADENGDYTVTLPYKLLAGREIQVSAKDAQGNKSAFTKLKVTDNTPPELTRLDAVYDYHTEIKGYVNGAYKVTALAGNTVLGTDTSYNSNDQDFSYSITVPKQKADTVITVRAVDKAGHTHEMIVTVIDKTAPAAPVVDPIDDNDEIITGKTEPNAKVVVSYRSATATADGSGNFTIPINTLPADWVVEVYAVDSAGNKGTTTKVTVKDDTPPKITVEPIGDSTTNIIGKTEIHTTIVLKTGDVELGRTTSDSYGNFYIPITKQKAGTVLTFSAEDSVGFKSADYTITVIDNTAPAAPTVAGVPDSFDWIGGWTEPQAKVEAFIGETSLGEVKASETGEFIIYITPLPAGTVIKVYSTDMSGNKSKAASVKVYDITPPTTLKVNPVGDNQDFITGSIDEPATIYVRIDAEYFIIERVNAGEFTIYFNEWLGAGRVIEVFADDLEANRSESAFVTVEDKTAPAAPVINTVTNKATTVTGRTEANADVAVTVGASSYKAKAKPDGTFSITIPIQNAGTKITAKATDLAGNTSAAAAATVSRIAPNLPAPVTVTNKAAYVTGRADASTTVTLKIGTLTYTGKASTTGIYKITIPIQNAGTSIAITAKDSRGLVSAPRSTKVTKVAPNMPAMVTVSNKAVYVLGKAEAYSSVVVKIGTKTYNGKASSTGTYKITIPVQNAGTSISITAKDKAGNVSAARSIKVTRVAPNMPTVNTVKTTSTSVTGKTEKYATVTVKIGSKVYSAKATSTGSFTVKIPKQKYGTKLYVNAKDSKKQVSATKIVSVVK
ncbi:Ig-like domain-containing protein [Fictibacillus aquaticus]|uniref:BIG2 domain-containing protein n=1 Tax=Fictibacillus aquaticus TaxID=2021314 RepID=A0A235F8P4_9BACL|nr:Ig-like domain-containing protein [Fictibacillus aquaticus]OYD57569.1 hypothetical protein CGZ90_12940 [Fictibacillus aquaticus]